jgi:SAM-dependent methyltransferase
MSVVFLMKQLLWAFWPLLPVSSFVLVPTRIVVGCHHHQGQPVVSFFKLQQQKQKQKQKRELQGQVQGQVQALIPQENPALDEAQTSLSGVYYSQVLDGLSQLYPPSSLQERNAASRTDGYWPFIQKGQDPPQQFTYGEFDMVFFAQLLDRVHDYYNYNNHDHDHDDDHDDDDDAWKDKVFCDIGSGTGRLVMGAAALHPGWKLCRGIEILPKIAQLAQDKLKQCADVDHNATSTTSTSTNNNKDDPQQDKDEWVENEHGLLIKAEVHDMDHANDNDSIATYSLPTANDKRLPLAPIEFVRGSFDDPYLYFGDVDCVFCFSSCMSNTILQSLSQAIGRQCRPGTIVITTDFALRLQGTIPPYPDDETLPHGNYKLELIEQLDGYCWLTGGLSTAYIHRVTQSLWNSSGPPSRPLLSMSEIAFRAICAMEARRDEAAVQFLTGVRNNMVFAGFPEPWLPDPSRYIKSNKQEQKGNQDY